MAAATTGGGGGGTANSVTCGHTAAASSCAIPANSTTHELTVLRGVCAKQDRSLSQAGCAQVAAPPGLAADAGATERIHAALSAFQTKMSSAAYSASAASAPAPHSSSLPAEPFPPHLSTLTPACATAAVQSAIRSGMINSAACGVCRSRPADSTSAASSQFTLESISSASARTAAAAAVAAARALTSTVNAAATVALASASAAQQPPSVPSSVFAGEPDYGAIAAATAAKQEAAEAADAAGRRAALMANFAQRSGIEGASAAPAPATSSATATATAATTATANATAAVEADVRPTSSAPHLWPSSLKIWVARCFNQCKCTAERTLMQAKIRAHVEEAARAGELQTRAWDQEELMPNTRDLSLPLHVEEKLVAASKGSAPTRKHGEREERREEKEEGGAAAAENARAPTQAEEKTRRGSSTHRDPWCALCSSRPCRCPKRASLQRFVRKRAQGKEGREEKEEKEEEGAGAVGKGEAPTRDPWCALCSSRPCRCAAPRYSGNYVPHASPGGDIAPSRDRRETYRSGRTAIDGSYPAPRHVRSPPHRDEPSHDVVRWGERQPPRRETDRWGEPERYHPVPSSWDEDRARRDDAHGASEGTREWHGSSSGHREIPYWDREYDASRYSYTRREYEETSRSAEEASSSYSDRDQRAGGRGAHREIGMSGHRRRFE